MPHSVITTLPTFLTIITTAVIDSINPCGFGVMILIISSALTAGSNVRRLMKLGLVYTFFVFLTYLLGGLGFLFLFSGIPLSLVEYLSMSVALLLMAAGIFEVKDYFWYGLGFSLAIPVGLSKKLETLSERSTTVSVAFLGIFVSAIELPCTGGPYLAVITLLSQYFDFTAFLLLILYNIIFVLPLLVMLLLVVLGVKLQDIKLWKQTNRGTMRLLTGVLLFILGWILIFMANGIINFG